MTKAVAKKAEAGLPAVIDFGADAGAGFEETDQSSFAIPFFTVLQSGSPQCKKSDGAYIKGAEEGMLYNNVSQEIFDPEDGITVVPCHYSRTFNEWKTRDDGGGLVAVHTAAEGEALLSTCHKGEKGEDLTPDGTQLVDTRNHYVLLVKDDGSFEPVFMPLSSTQITPSRRWMTMMNNIRINGQVAPMFSQLYTVNTIPKSNDKGSWYVVDFKHKEQISSPELYAAAKAFRESVRSGEAKPVEEAPATPQDDDEVPY